MVNPLSYPTSKLPFSLDTFREPPAEYRGAPFWAWVTKQEKARTVGQIDVMERMGMGGFHMHTRVGLDIPYMGEEYMDIVEGCVSKAKEKGMYAYLYDEDRWPSGFAGGQVLKGHPELRGLHLLFTPWPYGAVLPRSPYPIANAAPVRSELGDLLAKYAVTIVDGKLISSRILIDGQTSKETESTWYAYVEPNPDSEYMGDETYTDLLSSAMTDRFIELTHEVYKQHCGKEFGSTIPSIFTDEPQYCPMSTLNSANGDGQVFLPWTLGMVDSFRNKTGENLVELLPNIVWNAEGDHPGFARYQFLDHVCDLFTDNYIGRLAEWCSANDLMCTGHMNAEPTLASQTAQTGEVMRTYRDMHLPGIDMLCDNREYNTAKQASSVSRQYGRNGVMSEEYGVTGWQFTFEGHKGQGDWQAALGVTLRVHHLFWSTMKGEAKRDYPACIGYQSPWWEEYKVVESHFARVNAALTRGHAVTRVAVIHPIESFWLCYGPKDQHSAETAGRDLAFSQLTDWLLKSHLDFDFISESLFPGLTALEDISSKLPVGKCTYDVVIVPGLRTIRSTTLARLRRFAGQGGTVIVAGESPSMVDAMAGTPTIPRATHVPWSKDSLLESLMAFRDIDMIVNETTLYRTQGVRADSLVYQMRQDGDEKFIFICNTDRNEPCPVNITIRGSYTVQVLDTLSGESWELKSNHSEGKTHFKWYFDGCESLLVRLSPGSSSAQREQIVLRRDFMQCADVMLDSVSLSEPNALLLDYCSYQWNDEDWTAPEEVMRIDQILRERLGFFRKGAKFRQPHTIPIERRKPAGTLRLRFTFSSDIQVDQPLLAIENPDRVRITFDANLVASTPSGWWVDHDIETVLLPPIGPGRHELQLEMAYGPLTNLERVFVLGDFGVSVRGRTAKIVPLDLESFEWGDITRQNLPFYTGNLTYHCSLSADDQPVAVRVAHFACPAVAVELDGKRAGLLIHQPRALHLGVLSRGRHKLDLTCYGNRHNAFGALHLVPDKTNWLGADTWRTDFDWWSEEYVLGQVGIINAPRVEKPGREIPKQIRRGKHN